MTELWSLSIHALRSGIARAEFSAVEVTRHYLERIQAAQPILSAYTTIDEECALSQAIAVDEKISKGERIGLLAGVPLSVKDIIDVRGMATTCCSRSAIGNLARTDADVVAHLRAQDAIVIGKANCHEFAFGGPSFDLPFPPARNPWNPEFFPGGSSSGSGVAVAAGLCPASIGTDTAGSIRLPSAHCGIVGLKPGYDVISRQGVCPLSMTMDHVGPIARDVDDCRLVYECLAGHPAALKGASAKLRAGDLKMARIGIGITNWEIESQLHPDVLTVHDQTIALARENGAGAWPIRLPSLELVHAAASVVMMAEIAAHHSQAVHDRYLDYGSVFRTRVLAGKAVGVDDYLAAVSIRDSVTGKVDALFNDVDFILLPVSFNPPGKLISVDRFYFLGDPNINILANFVGMPAITLPCGLSSDGLPIGLQILGRRGAETALIDFAEGLEKHIGFRNRYKPALQFGN